MALGVFICHIKWFLLPDSIINQFQAGGQFPIVVYGAVAVSDLQKGRLSEVHRLFCPKILKNSVQGQGFIVA